MQLLVTPEGLMKKGFNKSQLSNREDSGILAHLNFSLKFVVSNYLVWK